eukprot:scaffold195_cov359-Prasinococcus_capsulatus_cf.AAC.3
MTTVAARIAHAPSGMCDCSACSSLGGGVKACCKAFSHCAGSALHTKSRMRSSGNRPLINTGSAARPTRPGPPSARRVSIGKGGDGTEP